MTTEFINKISIIESLPSWPDVHYLNWDIQQYLLKNHTFFSRSNSGRGSGTFGGSSYVAFPYYMFENQNWKNFRWVDEHVFTDYQVGFRDFRQHIPMFCTFAGMLSPLVQHLKTAIETRMEQEYKAFSAEINILPPGGKIGQHVDTAECVPKSHRCHMVLWTNNESVFTVDEMPFQFRQGECFTFNNALPHSVINNSLDFGRAHLVVDFALKNETFPKTMGPYLENISRRNIELKKPYTPAIL
jgi:hypothetical protein